MSSRSRRDYSYDVDLDEQRLLMVKDEGESRS
jgi:hypothetical protein